jgi:hypothetical protein
LPTSSLDSGTEWPKHRRCLAHRQDVGLRRSDQVIQARLRVRKMFPVQVFGQRGLSSPGHSSRRARRFPERHSQGFVSEMSPLRPARHLPTLARMRLAGCRSSKADLTPLPERSGCAAFEPACLLQAPDCDDRQRDPGAPEAAQAVLSRRLVWSTPSRSINAAAPPVVALGRTPGFRRPGARQVVEAPSSRDAVQRLPPSSSPCSLAACCATGPAPWDETPRPSGPARPPPFRRCRSPAVAPPGGPTGPRGFGAP